MPDNHESFTTIWPEYKATGDRQLRDQLVVLYAPLVKFIAGRLAVGLPESVERTDLVSYGIFGLIDAIEKFDLEHNVKFESYAAIRIRGAIIDELRSLDWVPRSVRAKARKVELALAALENRLRRSPTDDELAAELEMSASRLQQILGQISFVGIVGLDAVVGSYARRRPAFPTSSEALADPGDGPAAVFELKEMKQMLAAAVDRLSEREKIVVTLYYYEGLTLADIGMVLGVSESRVCQIHTKVILQLRTRIPKHDGPHDLSPAP